MNYNSYLCNYIAENPDDWLEKLRSYPYFLKIKEYDGLHIFNYNLLASDVICDEKNQEKIVSTDFSLPIVQEARGIIIDTKEMSVVCWPFRKFGNYGESYADSIDWSSAKVYEKIDGSICKLWFDKRKEYNCWRLSTNSVIDASIASDTNFYNFKELFDEATKEILDYNILNKNNTYIFELVSPITQVIIQYDKPKVYHIGTRNNLTGLECEENIQIQKPNIYKVSNIDECISLANNLNKTQKSKWAINHEGFVVCDNNYNRIKIKTPEYVLAHLDLSHDILSMKNVIDLLINNEIEEYTTYFPKHKKILIEYQNKYIKFKYNVKNYIKYAEKLYKKCNGNKKKVALKLKKDKYMFFAINKLYYNRSFDDTIKMFSKKKIQYFIENNHRFAKDNPSYIDYLNKENYVL